MISDRKYLDWLRTQQCVLTGQYGNDYESVVPAHIGTYAKGRKTDDEALPVLSSLHSDGHQTGEVSRLRDRVPNWLLRDALRAYARERYREWQEHGEWVGGKFY